MQSKQQQLPIPSNTEKANERRRQKRKEEQLRNRASANASSSRMQIELNRVEKRSDANTETGKNRSYWKPIVIVAFLLVIGTALFPPYRVIFQSTTAEVTGSSSKEISRFAPIFSPPERGFKANGEFMTLSGTVLDADIDMSVLAIEWAVIAAVAGIAIAFSIGRKN